MRLIRLSLRDFRCYPEVDLEPAPGLTAVVGENGSGKTSLLEAVAWLAEARSFRGAPDTATVREGAETAVVRGEVVRAERDRLVECEISRRGRNRIQVNRQRVPRAKALAETLQVTVFAPDDLELVKGGPGERRRLVDGLLTQAVPRLGAVVSEYEKVVRQRNALLRAGVRDVDDETTLEVWNAQLVRLGAEVVRARLRLLGRLEGPLAKAYARVAEHSRGPRAGDAGGRYEATWWEGPDEPTEHADLEGALAAAVERAGRRERDRGQTLVGPHRDDWHLTVRGLDARTHASQGEQRSLALALRLAGHELLTEIAGEPPVLLLDDVFSELDPGRAEALVAHLPPGQALVTTATELPPELPVELRVRVRDRRLEPA